jgi:hypothetical protein
MRSTLTGWTDADDEQDSSAIATAKQLTIKAEPEKDGGEEDRGEEGRRGDAEEGRRGDAEEGGGLMRGLAGGKRRGDQRERRCGLRHQPKRQRSAAVKAETRERERGGYGEEEKRKRGYKEHEPREEEVAKLHQKHHKAQQQQQRRRRLQVLSDETAEELVNRIAVVSAKRYGTKRDQRLLLMSYTPANATAKATSISTTPAYYLCYNQTQHCSMEWNALDLAPWITDEIGWVVVVVVV